MYELMLTCAVPVASVTAVPTEVPAGERICTFAPALNPPMAGTTVKRLVTEGAEGVEPVDELELPPQEANKQTKSKEEYFKLFNIYSAF